MLESCFLCGTRKLSSTPGLYEKGEWYCNDRCRHGGRGLYTIDEVIGLLRDAFGDNPKIMAKIRTSVARTLDAL